MTMKRSAGVVLVVLGCTAIAFSGSVAGPAGGPDIPATETITWDTERELVKRFENADDRVALAHRVMNSSLDPTLPLDDQERHDGLNIAAETFKHEGMFATAAVCFDRCLGLDISDSAHLWAIINKAEALYIGRQHQSAADAYLAAYNFADSIGSGRGVLISLMLVDAARRAGDLDLCYQIVDEIQSDPRQPSDQKADALYIASKAAYEHDDHGAAEAYLTTLLDTYPDYRVEDGHRIRLEMRLLEVQGHSIEDMDPQALIRAAEIMRDPTYQGLGNWCWAVDEIAKYLQHVDRLHDANKLRLWASQRVADRIASMPANSPDIPSLRKGQAIMLDKAADEYRSNNLPGHAETVYQMVADNFPDVRYFPDRANDVLQRLSTDGYPPVPITIPDELPPPAMP